MKHEQNFIEPDPEIVSFKYDRQIKVPEFINTNELPKFVIDNSFKISFPTVRAVPEHLQECFQYYYQQQIQNQTSKKLLPDPNRVMSAPEKNQLLWVMSYWTEENLLKLIKIHLKDTRCNFSLLDWLVTNYSKEFNEEAVFKRSDGSIFNIHSKYLDYVKFFPKQSLDAFAREPRILIEVEDTKREIFSKFTTIPKSNHCPIMWHNDLSFGLKWLDDHPKIYMITSVAQLNFMMWAYSSDLIEYCEEHINEIKDHMKTKKSKDKQPLNRRRHMVIKKSSQCNVRITQKNISLSDIFNDFLNFDRKDVKPQFVKK